MSQLLISKDSLSVLGHLYSGAKLPNPLPDEWEDCLKQLSKHNLVIYQIIGHDRIPGETGFFASRPIYEIVITETGKAYYESVQARSEFSEKQLEILQGISDRLEQRVDVAQKDAERAKKDSRTATIQSWIAIVISLISLASPLLESIFRSL